MSRPLLLWRLFVGLGLEGREDGTNKTNVLVWFSLGNFHQGSHDMSESWKGHRVGNASG